MPLAVHAPRALALSLLIVCCLVHGASAGRSLHASNGDTTALAALGALGQAVAQAASTVVTVDPTAQAALAPTAQAAAAPTQQSAADLVAPASATQPQYTYSSAAATSQPAVAYDSDGRAYMVMPANADDVAASQQQSIDATTPSSEEPKVQASGLLGWWALRNRLKGQSKPAPAPAPQVVVLPQPQPTQVAAEATPAPQPTQVLATPTVPTTIGSGGLKVVTSNPISISTPVKTVNPSYTATFTGGGGGLLGSAASLLSTGVNLLGALFPKGPGA